jgi:hypothetical protein
MSLCLSHTYLIRPRRTGNFVRETSRQPNVIVGMPVGVGVDFNERRPRLPQGILLFGRLRPRNDNHGAVALGVGHVGETNPGIARRPFDNRPTRLKLAVALQALHQKLGRPVLDGSARI